MAWQRATNRYVRTNRGWAEWRIPLLLAIGAPLVGLGLAVGTLLATTEGPAMLADHWAASTLMSLLELVGYALMLFTQFRYLNFVVFFAAFAAFFIGMYMITTAIEERGLHERGATATCAVLRVEKQEVTTTDRDPSRTRSKSISYTHFLDCRGAPVTHITTNTRVAEKGQEIDVRYDTAGRISPRLADTVGDRPWPLWPGFVLFGGGVVLRLLYELNVPVLRQLSFTLGRTDQLRFSWFFRRSPAAQRVEHAAGGCGPHGF